MIRLAIRCRAAAAERVLAELLELAPGGVEEDHGEDWVEYAIYGPPGEVPELPEVRAVAGDGLVEISATEIPDDWADRWRDFHRPVSVGDGRIVVRPSWETERPAADPGIPGREAEQPAADPGIPGREAEEMPGLDLIIDPGQAFGTGAHATTRICLELLLELADAGEARGSLADLGTGSGVLAICAAHLGWSPVAAFDSESAAVEAAGENAAVNGVTLVVRRLDLRREDPPGAATIVANLTAPLLISVAERLPAQVRLLVCSGLLRTEVDAVARAMSSAGLSVAATRSSGDWAALVCRAL